VVIEVLVHPTAPFLRTESAEEGMWMPRAFRLPALMKLANLYAELFLLANKITWI
jgi:hypothetical protein